MKKTKQSHRQCAGIDLGTEKAFCSVAGGRVKVFETFTSSLREMRDFLLAEQVTTAAMEATGVLWIPVYEVLTEAGIECCVVNAAHARHLPARKTDMKDCQWLAELHSKELLNSGFIPPAEIRELRDYWRLRKDHVEMGSTHLLHLQKALEQMNLKIHEVLSDMTGASALRLVEAILAGERRPEELLKQCDEQVLTSKRARMLAALEGTWKESQLFALEQAFASWKHYQEQMGRCDQKIQQLLGKLTASVPDPPTDQKLTRKRVCHNAPDIADLDLMLAKLCGGADLQKIPTLTSYTVAQVLAETGPDMSPWPTEKHFTAWLGLAPGARDSGKKKRNQRRFRGRAGKLFCVAARALARSKYLALGGFYRRIRGRRGGQVADIAAARKIAVLFYQTLKHGWRYVEQGLEDYERKYRAQMIRRLQAQAQLFGLTISTEPQPA